MTGGGPPALYDCEVSHTRTTPLRNHFRYATYLWLVDIDALPRLPRLLRPLAGFRAGDHLRGPATTLRGRVEARLADDGIDLAGGRVELLTAARVLGHVFNPISVWWCHRRDGSLAAVLAEVHNTYGGRHSYLLRPDERGRDTVEKTFYVSPFEPATGATYRLSLPEPTDRLDLIVTLHRPAAAPFVAGLRGRRQPATAGRLVRIALRHPVAPLVVAARIRWQGIKLVIRGMRVVPRPAGGPGAAAQGPHASSPIVPPSREAVR